MGERIHLSILTRRFYSLGYGLAFLVASVAAQCGTTVYDSGGAGGNYPNNQDQTWTYCAPAGQVVTLTFTAFNTEATWDELSVHNGPTNASPQLGIFSGTTIPGPITGTIPGGCLTLWFTSDGTINYSGWAINITCAPPPPPPMLCSGTIYDNGGAGGNYSNNSNNTITYCPSAAGQQLSLNFTTFDTEFGYDELTIFNGPNISSPGIGTFSGLGNLGMVTSTDPSGCLTLQFTSDGSVTYPGWAANVSCVPPLSNGCRLLLRLWDAFGDGWGSSNVGVRINGGAWTYYTVTADFYQLLINATTGDFIELSYNNSGPGQAQNSFSLLSMTGGSYYNSGTSPPNGAAFAMLVDCVPPPTPPQDCAGGTTICNGQTFNNSSNSTGNIDDLFPGNQDCLSQGEREGTWYYFSPSASGTIGFTIAPSVGSDDYDFALWGPMSNVTCPPTGPPLRCSYAAPTGPTGLGNGATDNSEGAGGDRWVSPINVIAGQIYILYVDNFSATGQSFNLSWQLSGGASLDCSVLPVSFLNVSAIQQHEAVDVAWTTQREEASDHFRVERSPDGRYFQPIGSLNAASVSTTAIDYHFIDRSPKNGPNHYRVVRVDEDGGTQVSNSVMVHFRAPGDRLVLVPNPAHDRIFLSLAPVDDAVNVHLFDATGRLLRTWVENVAAGPLTLPIGELESGAYTVLVGTASGEHLGHATFVKE